MARLIGPDEACRVVYVNSGTNKGKAAAQGMVAPLYLDEALTTLADVLTTAGTAIPLSTVTVDAYSKIPLVKYPDGVDTIYTSINGGPSTPLYARSDDRLDALDARTTALESGGASDTLALHKAGAETVTGVKTFSVEPVVPTPTAGTSPATKTYVDAGDAAAAALVDDLSGVSNAPAARTALGLGGAAVLAVGTTPGTVAAGDDARLTNTRTPTAHAASHAADGSDPVSLATLRTAVVAKALNYTLTAADGLVTVDATGGARTMTLPTAVGIPGKSFEIKRVSTGPNLVTVATTSAQTIDGASTYTLDGPQYAVTVRSDGANWQVISRRSVTSRSVHVDDFGAVPDGVTDCITAIRNAVSSLGATGGEVLFGPGVYGIGNTILRSKPGIVLRGVSPDATTIKALSALSAMILGTGTSVRKAMSVEGITFDAAGVAVVVDPLGYADAGTTYRNCRFVGVDNTNYLSVSGTHDILIENNEFSGTGATRGTAIPIGGGAKRITIRRNRFRYVENAIVVDTGVGTTSAETEFQFADSVIEGNTFDGGWYTIPYQASGSGGTVTYTATTVTDSAATFPTLTGTNNFNVRVLTPLATGTGGTVTYPRVELVDSAATFITAGVTRGMIVRVGTAFAVVANVRSETDIAVEEWLDDTTRARAAIPTAGTAYTVYGVVLGSIQSATGTALTVTRWHDLTGATVTPSAGTRYELLYQRPNYSIHCEVGSRNVRVSGNVLRRPWSDGISLYGPGVTIVDNSIEDTEDMGITSNGTAIISGNRIRRAGSGGIFSTGADSVITGNDIEDSTWVNGVDTRGLGDIIVYGGPRTLVTGNKCRTGGTRPQARHGLVLFDPATVDCVITGNEMSGHTIADYKVDQTVTGTNDIAFVKGVFAAGGGAGPQRLDIAGTGTPEGVVQGAVSSRFRRTDGGTGSTSYVKESGTGNTGWTALGQASSIRVTTTASSATPTPNVSTTDVFELSALAVTAAFAAPTGTPADGQSLLIRVKDNGGGQTLSWDAAYRAVGTTLPVVTTAGKQLYVGCKYNATASKFDVLAVGVEA